MGDRDTGQCVRLAASDAFVRSPGLRQTRLRVDRNQRIDCRVVRFDSIKIGARQIDARNLLFGEMLGKLFEA